MSIIAQQPAPPFDKAAMECAHLTFPSVGRLPPFPDEASLRLAVRTLARVAGRYVLLFCIVDDHFHVVLGSGGPSCVKIGQSILFALRPIAAVQLRAPHVEPVESRRHLQNLVGYLLRQVERHGLDTHPGLWSGSCFQDLVGARLIPELELPLRRFLPRLRSDAPLDIVGIPRPLVLLDETAMRDVGVARIVETAALVYAAGPVLEGKTTSNVRARRTAVHVAVRLGYETNEIARALGISNRSVRRLLSDPDLPHAPRAVRIRLSLERAVRVAETRAA
jgi:hypothetical protein